MAINLELLSGIGAQLFGDEVVIVHSRYLEHCELDQPFLQSCAHDKLKLIGHQTPSAQLRFLTLSWTGI